MNTFDENPFSANARPCMNCWQVFPVLFTYGGDNFERCASCHNEAREHYLAGGVLFGVEEDDYLY